MLNRLLLFVLVAAMAACSSVSQPRLAKRLPYTIGIKDVSFETFTDPRRAEEVADLRVDFDKQKLTKQLQESLMGVFENVIVLGSGNDQPHDLELSPKLRYDPRITTRGDGWLLSCFCFALGGPLGWFIHDRQYESPSSTLKCPVALTTVGKTGKDLLTLSMPSQPTEMTFWDRADTAPHYLGGLVMPAVFLASESDAVRQNLTEAMGRKLSEGLARGFLDKGPVLHKGLGADFELIDAAIVRSGGGYELQGSWSYLLGMLSDRVQAEYWLDGQLQPTQAEFADGKRNDKAVIKTLLVKLGSAKPGSFVHIRVKQIGGSGAERTYTLRVPSTDS